MIQLIPIALLAALAGLASKLAATGEQRSLREERDRLRRERDDLKARLDKLTQQKPSDYPAAPRSDDPLDNQPWLTLVMECVELFDEIERVCAGPDGKEREMFEHERSRLREILERSGVEVIADEPGFDLKRHQPEQADGIPQTGAAVAETLSPGFAVGGRVLRRAKVRLVPNDSTGGKRDE